MSPHPKSGQATIRDVALRARVSPMTVSNFTNARFHLMTEETRARIEAAIEALDYRPRLHARSLKLNKDFSVGMIVVDPSPNFLVEPFIGHVVSGLSSELAANGYACLLQGLRSCDEDQAVIRNFTRSDALCVFASGTRAARRAFLCKLAGFGAPIVAIEEDRLFESDDIAIVRQDDAEGARMLVEHLLALGARRFTYIAPAPIWSANATRELTIRRTLRRFREPTQLRKLSCGYGNFDEVRESIAAWLDSGPIGDAIMANNDHIGIAVLKTLAARSIRVPRDIMMTGFNGFEFWNYSDPLLTTVVSPAHGMGQVAARALLERLDSGRFSRREWVLPVAFQQGETTPGQATRDRSARRGRKRAPGDRIRD
jgi:LacI family transcriptional regulator